MLRPSYCSAAEHHACLPRRSEKAIGFATAWPMTRAELKPIYTGLRLAAPESTTFEKMSRPNRADEFANWLVPARNNIQREMLRLRQPFKFPYIVGYPMWVFRTRRLVLGAFLSGGPYFRHVLLLWK